MSESSNELVVKPAPHISAPMTKTRLMQYTFFAILAVTVVSAAVMSQVTTPSGWNLGLTVAVGALIAIGVAVGIDILIGKLASDSEINLWSAMVFGLIVINCYTLGIPAMNLGTPGIPAEAPLAFFYIAAISALGMGVFKKVASMAGRKFVNPAAAAKFLVLLPVIGSTFMITEHLTSNAGNMLGVPALAGPISATDIIGENGFASFGTYLQGCYANPAMMESLPDIPTLMLLTKYHGWVGGASSIAVIIAGIALFVLARKYIKWKITVSYLVSIAALSLIFSFMFGDADLTTRLLFTMFMGSSIFLAFFMATDPATTPLSGIGQIIFGVGLAVFTILIQTYMNFFGGSILALLIMNLTVPLIDRIGIRKPFGR
jgi:Na+-translocating ferredoxin:NAD+ oxidoreductase RnfD subunit